MPSRNPPALLALLALLTVATLLVRAWRLDAGLPYRTEPDAVLVWQASAMERLAREQDPESQVRVTTFYPLLLARLLHVLPGNSAPVAASPEAPLERHLAAAGEPYRRGRWLVLVLSTLLVPLTFCVARRFLDAPWALLAAAFAATSVLHASLSQMARPHGPLTSACLLAVLASLRLFERGGLRATLHAGLAAGLAVSTLHSGVFAVPTALAAAWFAPTDRGPGRWWRVALVCGCVLVLAVWSYPFLAERLGLEGDGEGGELLMLGDQKLSIAQYGPAGYLRIVPNLFAVDPLLVIGGLAGLVALVPLLRGRPELRRPLWIAGLHPVSTLLLFGLHPTVPSRFLLPVVPWLALLTAAALWALLARWARPALSVATASLALVLPIFASAYYVRFRGAEDSQTRLARWLEDHRPPGRFPVVATNGVSLPLFLRPQRWAPETDWIWSPWIAYLVEFKDTVRRPEALDVLPLLEDQGPGSFEELVRDLAHLAPGLFVVRRPIVGQEVRLYGRPLPRERLVAAFGEPLLVLDPGRGREGPLTSRALGLLPQDLAHIAARRYPGMGYEVYALPTRP